MVWGSFAQGPDWLAGQQASQQASFVESLGAMGSNNILWAPGRAIVGRGSLVETSIQGAHEDSNRRGGQGSPQPSDVGPAEGPSRDQVYLKRCSTLTLGRRGFGIHVKQVLNQDNLFNVCPGSPPPGSSQTLPSIPLRPNQRAAIPSKTRVCPLVI